MSGLLRHARRPTAGTVAVALVLALAGLLFAANAHLAQGQEARHPQDLRELVSAESERLTKLSLQVDGLRSQVDELASSQNASTGTVVDDQTGLVELTSGRTAVTGPGVTVRLTDAPTDIPRGSSYRVDDLVVHQQDIQVVMNALWAGGAEAMSLQDQRVISTTAFRCVGNVLSLHGRLYSPPYVIRAIGDPKHLRAALNASPAIQTYLEYVDAVGLGWSVTTQSALDLPAYEGTTDLRYASVPDGIDVATGTTSGPAPKTGTTTVGPPTSKPTSTPPGTQGTDVAH